MEWDLNSGWLALGAALVTQTVKNLPATQETWVQFLGREDPLEKEMATHSSILTWRIPWTEEPGGLQSMLSQRVRQDWWTNYQVQAHSACCTRGQWIQEMRGCGKEETLIGESADQEDGRLVPQNNPLTEVWVPGSLLQIRDGGVGEEAQWKGHLSCKHLLEWQASGRGCVNFILPAICRWTGFWTKAL